MVDIQCVWEEPAILGEGPLWVARCAMDLHIPYSCIKF